MRKSKHIKNIILKGITGLSVVSLLWAILCMDAEHTAVPMITALVSLAWLVLFLIANDWFDKEDDIDNE